MLIQSLKHEHHSSKTLTESVCGRQKIDSRLNQSDEGSPVNTITYFMYKIKSFYLVFVVLESKFKPYQLFMLSGFSNTASVKHMK